MTGILSAGLPNITGTFTVGRAGTRGGTGAFIGTTNGNGYGEGSYGDDSSGTVYFNASNSNIIYGNSDTVQPPAFALIPQIRF